MEKITKEQFYLTAKGSRGRPKNKLMIEIEKIELDEGLSVTLKELKENYPQSTNANIHIVLQTFRKDRSEKKFTTHTLKPLSGRVGRL